jgi:glycosyltransferase involved in cell wall biosynthesis
MKFSIVTPSYNQGAFIGRTLESVAGQGVASLEHLVMDGGSRDDTCRILAASGPGVTWVSEPDRGQTDALNKGLRRSRGQIIGWLNSDDVYFPGALEAVETIFDRHPDVDVVYGLADHIDTEDEFIAPYPVEAWDPERLDSTCIICQPALFFRRGLLERCGYPDESLDYCMDYEYWLRLRDAGARFYFLERRLAGSRMYPQNKTLGSRLAVHAEINEMFRHRSGRVPDAWILNYAHALVESRVPREQWPRFFVMALLFAAIGAGLRWNRGLSPTLRRVLLSWYEGMRSRRGETR